MNSFHVFKIGGPRISTVFSMNGRRRVGALFPPVADCVNAVFANILDKDLASINIITILILESAVLSIGNAISLFEVLGAIRACPRGYFWLKFYLSDNRFDKFGHIFYKVHGLIITRGIPQNCGDIVRLLNFELSSKSW